MTELYTKWLSMVDFPAVILLMMALLGVYVLYQTQKSKSNNFDFADMLRDDAGKPSAFRLAIFVCLAISSWAIMYIIMQTKGIDIWLIVFYMLIWSGAKIAEKIVDAYAGSKGGVPTAPPTSEEK
jgi:amino acid transporter